MNYIILCNRKRGWGGAVGDIGITEDKHNRWEKQCDCWIKTDMWKVKCSPSELFIQQPLQSGMRDFIEQESGLGGNLDHVSVLSYWVIKTVTTSFSSGRWIGNLSNTLTEQSLARQTRIYRCEVLHNVHLHGCQPGLLMRNITQTWSTPSQEERWALSDLTPLNTASHLNV